MFTHLIALTYRETDWLVSENGSKRTPIGTVELRETFDASVFDETGRFSRYIGSFPDLLSAANAVYGVSMAVQA